MGSYYRRDTHIGNDCSRSGRKKYAPGVTDTEIKLGQTSPYSGPASAYSVTRNKNFTPVMIRLRLQMLMPVSERCN